MRVSDEATMERKGATVRWRPPARAAALASAALVLAGALFVAVRSGTEPAGVLRAGDDPGTTPGVPTTPVVTIPEVPEVVDDRTLEDGWYLILATQIFTTEDEPLLQVARELVIEARAVGYADAKIVPRRAVPSTCEYHAKTEEEGTVSCVDGDGGGGYFVLLKGPYDVPDWTDSDADLDAEFEWHQTTQAGEVEEAARRGLTATPGIERFEFP